MRGTRRGPVGLGSLAAGTTVACLIALACVAGTAGSASALRPGRLLWEWKMPTDESGSFIGLAGGQVIVTGVEGKERLTALNRTNGHVIWQRRQQTYPSLFATGRNSVWTGPSVRGDLIERASLTGTVINRVAPPIGTRWVWIAAYGDTLYATLVRGTAQELLIDTPGHRLTVAKLARVGPSPAGDLFACTVSASSTIYLLCGLHPERLYRVSATTGRVVASRTVPDSTFCCPVADGNAVIADDQVSAETQSRALLRYNARTLARETVSGPLPFVGRIAVATIGILAVADAGTSARILVFSPSTFKLTASVPLPPEAVAATGVDAVGGSTAYLGSATRRLQNTVVAVSLPARSRSRR